METAEPQRHTENTASKEISLDLWKVLQEHSSSKPVLNLRTVELTLPSKADSPGQTPRTVLMRRITLVAVPAGFVCWELWVVGGAGDGEWWLWGYEHRAVL